MISNRTIASCSTASGFQAVQFKSKLNPIQNSILAMPNHRDSRSRSPLPRHSAPSKTHWQSSNSSQWSDRWQQSWSEYDQVYKADTWASTSWDHSSSARSANSPSKFQRPPTWKPNEDFHDTQELHGLALGRTVAKTAWSTEKGIAGKNIEDITLMDLAYQGPQNWFLRHISAGRFTTIEFTRSTKESMLVQSMIRACRAKETSLSNTDIDKLIMAYSDLPNTSTTKLQDHYNAACIKLVNQMKLATEGGQAEANLNRIRDLEQQLAEARSSKPQSGATPTKPSTPTKAQMGIARLFSPKLPVKATDDYQEQDTADDDDVHKDIRKPLKATKVLLRTAPSTLTANTIDKWMKETLNKEQYKTAKSQVAELTKYYNTIPKEHKSEISSVAVDWGLPVKLAAAADTNQLLKLIVSAIHMTK